MNRSEAVERMTHVATRAGQPITSDETFELFAALVPDSPWSTRLLKLRDAFNDLATAATMINEQGALAKCDEALESEPDLAENPELKIMRTAFVLLHNAMNGIRATSEVAIHASKEIIPTPAPVRHRNPVDNGLDELLDMLDPSRNEHSPQPLDIHDLARQAGAMRYQSEVPNFGSVSGWSFRDTHLEAFVKAVRDHGQ